MDQEKLDKTVEELKDKLTFKFVAQGLTGMVVRNSVSAVVVAIVHNLVPDDSLSRKQKAQLYVASWAMGGAASQRASNWAKHRVGENIETAIWLKKLVTNEETSEETPEKDTQTEKVNPTEE